MNIDQSIDNRSSSTDSANIPVRPLRNLTNISNFWQPNFDVTPTPLANILAKRSKKPPSRFEYSDTDWKYPYFLA
jgi:hypothetical protein